MGSGGYDELALYVPEEFQAAHVEEARRTVNRSLR